jgi:hypothetical protein
MKYRISYVEPDGVTGTIEIDADSLTDAYRKGNKAIPPGADIQGRPTDITPAEATGKSGPDATKNDDVDTNADASGGSGSGGSGLDQASVDAMIAAALADQENQNKQHMQSILDLLGSQSAGGPEASPNPNTTVNAGGPETTYDSAGGFNWNPSTDNQEMNPLDWNKDLDHIVSNINYQTGAGPGAWGEDFRNQMIERQSGLGSFLEGISQTFGGDMPGGYQGQNYLESLFNPAASAYGALNTLGSPYKSGGQVGDSFAKFANNLFSSAIDPRKQLDALLGSALDRLSAYDPKTLDALAPAAEGRIRKLINPDVITEGGGGWDSIKEIVNLAQQAQGQRYSPMALRSMQRGQGNADQIWADFTRQRNAPGTGSEQNTGFQNFARFVKNQFGL